VSPGEFFLEFRKYLELFNFLKKLFKNNQRKDIQVGKLELSIPASDLSLRKSSFSGGKLQVASCQSIGVERPHNEDTVFTLTTLLNDIQSPQSIGIFIVADGMGGHQSGEVASCLAIKAVSQMLIDQALKRVFFNNETLSEEFCKKSLKRAIDEAQANVQRHVPGGGTTLTMVLSINDMFFFAHVGDSRLYHLDLEGRINLITKDHSLVKRLVDLGEITEREAATHPQRNVLYKALGQSDPFQPDIGTINVEVGERLLICSDGLWGALDDEIIEIMMQKMPNLNQLVSDLVGAANDAGGPDNISVVLVERLS